jgi:hypothetical protein
MFTFADSHGVPCHLQISLGCFPVNTLFFSKNIMTSPRLPLVKAQVFVRNMPEYLTPWTQSESNSATYKKTEVRNSLGFRFEVRKIQKFES